MAIAGFCRVCQQNVWLNEQWGCVNGHAWSEISKWYDPASGTAVTPHWMQPVPAVAAATTLPTVPAAPTPAAAAAPAVTAAAAPTAAAPAPAVSAAAPPPTPAPALVVEPAAAGDTREQLLEALLELFAQYPTYHVQRGTDTDLVIDNKVADAVWAGGKKKVEYTAMLKADDAERTVYLWEAIKDVSSGFSFGGVQSESWSTSGTRRSGKTKGATLTPDGVKAAYDWDYAATRQLVESVAVPVAWKVKVVLKKSSARWK